MIVNERFRVDVFVNKDKEAWIRNYLNSYHYTQLKLARHDFTLYTQNDHVEYT